MHQIEDLDPDEGILLNDGRLHFADAVLYCQIWEGARHHTAVNRVRNARDGWTDPEQVTVMPDGSIIVHQP